MGRRTVQLRRGGRGGGAAAVGCMPFYSLSLSLPLTHINVIHGHTWTKTVLFDNLTSVC